MSETYGGDLYREIALAWCHLCDAHHILRDIEREESIGEAKS